MAKKPTDGVDYHDKMIIAHAVFACIATLFTAPAAILIGRYFRGRPWWFKAHLWLQSVTASCIIIVFAVGIVAVLSGASHIVQLTGPKADAHHDLGLAILILFLLQYLLGIAAHYTHSAGPAGAERRRVSHPFDPEARPPPPARVLRRCNDSAALCWC
ncbi:Cytochrome b561 domain-containing protein [Mycena indigotica]|uniref:Cytochrome b561 domain-containing protein n=1 Tax=Mycena indigotica TaxID=2126181 RepID=A0A8H6S4T1_9AGAR|nr:Cytochrome b561 domain-containing protein [Mycena indigotica]KAF7292046.1 Cytochrome b561 domain-containing protein [Mycena indigotica]